MQAFLHLQDFERVIAAYGRWSSFHDAEVHRIALIRAVPCGAEPNLELEVHAWNMTSEVTSEGYYRLTHHHLITFLFEEVSRVRGEKGPCY